MATAVIDRQLNKLPGRRTGKAPAIRKLAMRNPELSEADIAKALDCSRANVNQVLKKFLGETQSHTELAQYQESKADIYDSLQSRILGSISKEDIAKAPLVARVTSAAILEDKARVIRGQATQINVSVLLDAVSEARKAQAERAAEAMAGVRARMAAERAGE
jgi:predicted transcriptional regulator